MRFTCLTALMLALAGCEAASDCMDGTRDGTETDVDCGGSCGLKCATGRSCVAASDCDTSLCAAGTCVEPSCLDSLKNAGETDVDCGGPSCARCGEGRACAADSDCQTENCDTSRCAPAASLITIEPALGPVTGGSVVTLTGVSFRAGAAVSFGATPATDIIVSGTEIKARVPATMMPELVDVNVQLGNRKLTLPRGYRYSWGTVGMGAEASTALPGSATGLWVGDLNGDRLPDVLTANFERDSVTLLRGRAGGGFEARVNFAAGRAPSKVAVGDFNKDRKLDFAVSNFNDGTVGVFINNGDMTFKAPVTYAAGGTAVMGLIVADLNGDGNPDLASSHSGGTPRTTVYLGRGDAMGTFQAGAHYADGAEAQALTVGDFNGDGRPDLASAHTNQVGVFLNNGDGTLGARVDYAAARYTADIVAVDLNGDGRADLATTESAGSRLGVLLNKGDGTGTFNGIMDTPLSWDTRGIGFGDADRDGKMDLVVSTELGASLLLGNGDGTFKPPITSAGGARSSGVALVDMDGDGKLDFVGTSGPRLSLLPGTAM